MSAEPQPICREMLHYFSSRGAWFGTKRSAVRSGMPFTPTHILAITPIAAACRERLPFTALAIGSMIPDLPIFLSIAPRYQTTHSVPGLFVACLPIGMVAYVVFEALMKRPLLALLPPAIRCRCAAIARPQTGPSLRAAFFAALAVTAGAATHIVWDAFTHDGGWGTQLVPWLNTTALTIAGHSLPGYKLAQYGSTAVGLPLLVALAVTWLRRQEPVPLESLPSVPQAVRFAVVIAVLVTLAVTTRPLWGGDASRLYGRLGRSISDSGLALLIEVLAFCLVVRACDAQR
jgi:Domain of unknown function (DUF4184)